MSMARFLSDSGIILIWITSKYILRILNMLTFSMKFDFIKCFNDDYIEQFGQSLLAVINIRLGDFG